MPIPAPEDLPGASPQPLHTTHGALADALSGALPYCSGTVDHGDALLNAVRTQFIVSISDASGVLLEVNDAFCAISQYGRDELLGANHRIVRSGHHPDAFFAHMWQTISAGQSWRGAICNRAKDGSTYWVDSVIAPLRDGQGQVTRYVSVRTDISDRYLQQQALALAHERMRMATDSGGIGVWSFDVESGQMSWDDWMCRLYGHPPGSHQIHAEVWAQQLHAQDLARVRRALQDAAAGGLPMDAEFRVWRQDGALRHVRATAKLRGEPDDTGSVLVGVSWDVTELRQLAANLTEQHELLRVTLRSIGDAVITTDAQGRVSWLNPVAERLTGWVSSVAEGLALSQVFRIVHEQTRAPADSPVALCLADGQAVGLASQTVLISRDGTEYGIEDSAAPIRGDDGRLIGAVLVFHDVSEQRRMSGEMTYRATHDQLTGLVNRAEFEARLQRLLQRVQSDESTHALLYIDLDQFKLVNDACGHAAGDLLLLQVGRLLGESVRGRDTLARLGGDEFGLILENCSLAQAARLAQQACDRIDDYRFQHDEQRFRIGASIGLVPVDARWSSMSSVLKAADTSCYAAKDAGRNRVHTWCDSDEAMHARQFEMQWAARIERALDEQQFVLMAQRIVPLHADRHALHAEVLLRMRGDDGQLILPDAFLPAAERFNLVSRIDRWVLRTVLTWLDRATAAGPVGTAASLGDLRWVSVNLSGQSVGDRAFQDWAIQSLAQASVDSCARLCLEITETAAVTNLADAARFIEQVRAVGVRVALDDFGAGASSFTYLKTLPVDYLKIDGKFVRDLVRDKLDEVAVRCFVDVAQVMGLRTVAEWVDNAAVYERLRELGVDYAQGFLIHRPEPLDELLHADARFAMGHRARSAR